MATLNLEVGKIYRNGLNEFVEIAHKHGLGDNFIQFEDTLGRTYSVAGKYREDKATVFDLHREKASGEVPTDITVQQHPKAYAHLGEYAPHEVVSFQVVAILDMVPGAFHEPGDLMSWIANNPYVRSVSMLDQ